MEAIVNGPNKKGEYEVKWEGFDSSTNTWEKRSGLPKQLLHEYGKDKGSSSDDDNEPIAKKIKRRAFTQ